MDIQKYFTKGPVIWYAVFTGNRLQRISDEYIEGSILFQTQTYETAEDTPNAIAEIKELFNIPDYKKQGYIELVFLKIMLSPRILRIARFHKAFKVKVEEAFDNLQHSKIIKDAPKVLEMNQPIIKNILQPI